jgi:hypothetical protein
MKPLDDITGAIIDAAMKIHIDLGPRPPQKLRPLLRLRYHNSLVPRSRGQIENCEREFSALFRYHTPHSLKPKAAIIRGSARNLEAKEDPRFGLSIHGQSTIAPA